MAESFAFNPLDPSVRRDPYALYARGRRESPILLHEGLPIRLYSAFRHEDCQAVLRDADRWSNRFREEEQWNEPQFRDLGPQPPPTMLLTDGDTHARLRGLVNKAFTPRIVQRLEPRLHEIAHELVDVERVRAQRQLLKTMREYFIPLAEDRRRAPREDLLTGLVQARHEGSRLSDDEMLQMLVLILVAGNETTTNLIGNAVVSLLEHPDQLAKLRASPELMGSAVEEVLRFSSPVQFDPRRATRPLELRGHKIEQDGVVLCWLGSANRDEAVFERPYVFDIARPRGNHLAFGFGAHYCLGANLARLETEVALAALLEGTRKIERLDTEPLPLHPSPVFRGVTSLPVRLTR